MYSGVFYQRYILGLWVVAEGVIYDMFDRVKHTIKEFVDLITDIYYVSVDYGTQNATVFLLWCKNRQGKWICIKEYYYSGRDETEQKTDAEYADDLKEFLGSIKPKAVIVDPSAASFIAELRKRGYQIKKAKNDVLDGIRFVATLLNQELIAFSEECRNTILEFNSYIWDAKACERGEDKPIKQHDHAMDAVRYFCYTIIFKGNGISILK
jgi:PBSX family phage terminase large subunit